MKLGRLSRIHQPVGRLYKKRSTAVSAATALVSFDGSSLTGWTVTDAATNPPTITQAQGNPAPSWQMIGRGFRQNLGINYLNKTIAFDVSPGTGCDIGISWAQNSNGNSAYRGQLRIRQSATATLQGLTLTDNGAWLYIGNAGNETAALFPVANAWSSIKVRIATNRVCTWTLNGVLQASTITLPVGYTSADTTNTWFGFIGNGGGTSQFDNLVIYDGIV